MDKEFRDLERKILAGETDRLPEYLTYHSRRGNTATLYVVVCESFDYDDNHYYQSEAGGGEPLRAFLSREAAQDEVRRLTAGWLREHAYDLEDWSYEGWAGLVDMDEIELTNFLSARGATLIERGVDVSGCTDEQCREIVDALSISPYTIREIPLTDGVCQPDDVLRFCHQHGAPRQPPEPDAPDDES